MAEKTVLIVGLEPTLIDFSDPAYGFVPGINADKVKAGLDVSENALKELGYAAEQCLIDFGDTAETVLQERLAQQHYDCVLIGAGVRVVESNFLLFEKVINVVHRHAPQARLCFNTRPDDTAESVRRWV